jgi:rRNA maturation RNase YbeY
VNCVVEVVDQVGLTGGDQPIVELVKAVLQAEGVAGELVVALVDEKTITDLNRRYRGLEEPTDVLSFRALEGAADWPRTLGDEAAGELIVCPAVVARYALEDGRSANLQLSWTLIHGVLHLLGYDHEADQGEMRVREQALVDALGPLSRVLPALAEKGKPW